MHELMKERERLDDQINAPVTSSDRAVFKGIAAEQNEREGWLARQILLGWMVRYRAGSIPFPDRRTALDRLPDATAPDSMISPVVRTAEKRLRLLPYEPEASADEPREIHESEVAVVAYAAAGDGEVELVETGETTLVNNTIARRVQAGKGFVAKVSGESMETRLSNGDLVYFQHATAETVPDGAIVYVLYEGKNMVKILRFVQGREGTRKDWRLVSHNKNRKKYPTIHLQKDFRVMGWAQERVDKGLGAERFRDLEE